MTRQATHRRLSAASPARVLDADILSRIIYEAATVPSGSRDLARGCVRVRGGAFLDQSFLATWRSHDGAHDSGVAGSPTQEHVGRVGITCVMAEGFVWVLEASSPALDAGVRQMDRLVAVNGNIVSDAERACAMASGPPNSAVRLSIARGASGFGWGSGEVTHHEITVVRRPLERGDLKGRVVASEDPASNP